MRPRIIIVPEFATIAADAFEYFGELECNICCRCCDDNRNKNKSADC